MDVYSEEREQTSTSSATGQRSSTTTGASSSIRARARAYAREEISLAYFESLGRDIPRYCQVIVDEMLDDGIEARGDLLRAPRGGQGPQPFMAVCGCGDSPAVSGRASAPRRTYPQARPGRIHSTFHRMGHRPARYANRCTPNGNTRRRTSSPPGCRSASAR